MRGDHPSPGYRLMSNVSCRRHHLFTVGVLLNSAARSPALTTPRPPVSVRVAADFLSGSFQSPGPFHFPVFPSLLPQATALPDFNHSGVFRSLLAVSCVLLAAGILEGTVRSESKPLLLLPPVSEVEGPGRAGGACLRASFLASLLLPGAVLPAGAAVHGCEDGQRRRSELSKEEHKQPWARVMGGVTSVLSEDRLERKGPLRPAPRGLGEAEQSPCVRSGSELWSLAPAFGPSPVVRPVPTLLRCSPCLGSAFLLVKALRQLPAPTARSAHGRNRRGRACGGAPPADLALPAGAPQSVQPCPTRPQI